MVPNGPNKSLCLCLYLRQSTQVQNHYSIRQESQHRIDTALSRYNGHMTCMSCLPRKMSQEPAFNCSLPPMGGHSRLAQNGVQVGAPAPIFIL